MSERIEEIRQENRSGDVSYRDVAWLCRVAEIAERIVRQPWNHIARADLIALREAVSEENHDG